jgi:hypothetical protein
LIRTEPVTEIPLRFYSFHLRPDAQPQPNALLAAGLGDGPGTHPPGLLIVNLPPSAHI